MEATPALDSDANHRQPYPDRGPILADIISVAQGSQVVPSELDACRSLARAINCPLVHSPSPERDLEFIGGVLPPPHPRTGWHGSGIISKKLIIKSPHRPPRFLIETNCALLQHTAIPVVEIPPVPLEKKLKFKDYTSDDDVRCGYDSYNEYGPFLDAVAGEEDCEDDKYLPDSMVGECMKGN